MPLALETLIFDVQTEKLLAAKRAIDDLGSSMQNLNKIQKEETQTAINSEKVKQQEAKTSEAIAKAKIAEAKAEQALDSAKKSSSDTSKESVSVLERQRTILEFMTQGYSKGQSSVLAYAKASGSATEEIKDLANVLEVQRKLMGASPFDKSMSGLTALKNQYGEVREAIRQYNSDSGLTSSQTRELARDKERIIEKLKQEGAGLSQIKQAIREYNSAYLETANRVNSLSKVEKDRERVMRDTTNAARNVQAAEERLFATVSHLNDVQGNSVKLNERAALAIGSYERNLRLAGISGEAAAKKLQAFKVAQEQVTAAEAKNRASYVARGVGVQLGDVGVSLASGMNPLVVAIQQGDQLRSIIQQSGLETTQMAGIMNQAFKGIITSFKDVGVAMGSFVLGGITTVGKSASDMALKMTGFSLAIKALRKDFVDLQNTTAGPVIPDYKAKFAGFIESMLQSRAAAILFGSALSAIVIGLGVAVGAYLKTAKAIDSMNEALVLHGARLGATREELVKLSTATAGVTSSSNDMKAFFSELISGGFSSKESLIAVGNAARELSAVTSLSLQDVAKMYNDLSKDPVEALIKLGIETGNVSVETIRYVEELKKQGNTVAATEVAIKAMADAHMKSAKEIRDNLSPIGTLLLRIKENWNALKEAAISAGNEVAKALLKIQSFYSPLGDKIDEAKLGVKFASGIISKEEYQAEIEAMKKNANAKNDWFKNVIDGNSLVLNSGKKFNSDQVRLEQQRIETMKSFAKVEDDLLTKKLSKSEYVSKKLQDTRAKMGNQELFGDDFKSVKAFYEKEWESANKGTGGKGKSPVSTQLRNELDDFKRYQAEEQAIYKSRLDTLKYYYEQGYHTVEDYFSREQAAIDDNLENQRRSVDERLKILETYKSKAKNQKDEADLQGKINALLDERNKIEREGTQQSLELSQKRTAELLAYKKTLTDVNVEILTLQKNYAEAAKLRAESQYDERITKAERSDPALAEQLKFLKQYQIEKGRVDQLSGGFGTISSELQNKEQRINNARTQGTIGEIDALYQLGEARQAAYDKMKGLMEQYDAYMAMDPTKMTDAQKQSFAMLAPEIDKIRLSMENLNVTMSPLQTKFKELFTDSFSNAFTSFVTGSKSASAAFSDFANNIIKEMINIAARQAALNLIGLFASLVMPAVSSGPSTGGSWLGNAPASTPAGYSPGTLGSGVRFSANGNAFTQSGIVQAFANGGTFTNSIVDSPTAFMFANGGALGVMGEAGPEAILPLQRASNGKLGVVSSGGNDSPINISVNVTVASDGSTKTETNASGYGKELGTLIARSVQAEIIKQKRNGGLLAA